MSLNAIDLATNYGDEAASAPDRVSASKLDADHLEIERWINQVLLPTLAKIIRSDDTLVDRIVRARNLHPDALAEIRAGMGSVEVAVPADASVTAAKLAVGAVTAAALAAGSVTADALAAGSVVAAALADGAVTAPKIQNQAITPTKLASGAVITSSLADSAVTNAKMAAVNANIIKGRKTAGPGPVEDLSASDVIALLGINAVIATGRTIGAPNAARPVHSLSATGTEDIIDLALVPKGSGSITASVPDGTAAGGDKRGMQAVDFQTQRAGADQVALAPRSVLLGGDSNKISESGVGGAAIGGDQCRVSGIGAACIAATGAIAAHNLALVHGTAGQSKQRNSRVHGCASLVNGDGCQGEELALRVTTTNATATPICDDGVAQSIVLDDGEVVHILAQVVAAQDGSASAAGYAVEATAKRGSGAGSVALVGAPTVRAQEDAAGWNVTVTADTINGRINLNAVGAVGATIHWFAWVRIARARHTTS